MRTKPLIARSGRAGWSALVYTALTFSGCSLQSFDYLEDSAGPTGGDGGDLAPDASLADGSAPPGDAGPSSTAGSRDGGGASTEGGANGTNADASNGGSEAGAGDGAAGETTDASTDGTGEGGLPQGNLLANSSFEMDLLDWSVDPASALASRYVYIQGAQGTAVVYDGAKELATWHGTDAYTVSVYQTVNGLVPGTYALKAYFASTKSQGAFLFARNCGEAEQQVVIPTVTDVWFEIEIPAVNVTGTSCEVGFSVRAVANDWLNADLITFEKVP